MKRNLILTVLLFLIIAPSYALNFGMYKPEEDYGIFDGFKVNFNKKDREASGKFFQVKSDIPEEKQRIEKEKEAYEADKDRKADDEYQMFKFMLDDTVAF